MSEPETYLDLKVGDPVDIRGQEPGIERHAVAAEVTEIIGIYIIVTTDTGKRDQFYRESGWRCYDGEMRWRLERPGGAS